MKLAYIEPYLMNKILYLIEIVNNQEICEEHRSDKGHSTFGRNVFQDLGIPIMEPTQRRTQLLIQIITQVYSERRTNVYKTVNSSGILTYKREVAGTTPPDMPGVVKGH